MVGRKTALVGWGVFVGGGSVVTGGDEQLDKIINIITNKVLQNNLMQ
jgi:hypothetical protein